MPTQVQNGKAFEYALIHEANSILSPQVNVNIVQNASYLTCQGCFNLFTVAQQTRFLSAANAAIAHVVLLEPKLTNPLNAADILTLELQDDAAGRAGDVRDLLLTRLAQNWEIGISAKNNHKALKHSRLSIVKDFGQSWVGVPSSMNYFAAITPYFNQLALYRGQGMLWRNVANKAANFYQPILQAFSSELDRININNPNIPQNLVSYLVGRKDFYKIMKRTRVVEVLAFNLHGTLGQNAARIRPVLSVPRLTLPTQIIQSQIRPNALGTLDMIFDQGWQLSFRIHSAETIVAASLKFDVNLIGQPNSMYSHHIPY